MGTIGGAGDGPAGLGRLRAVRPGTLRAREREEVLLRGQPGRLPGRGRRHEHVGHQRGGGWDGCPRGTGATPPTATPSPPRCARSSRGSRRTPRTAPGRRTSSPWTTSPSHARGRSSVRTPTRTPRPRACVRAAGVLQDVLEANQAQKRQRGQLVGALGLQRLLHPLLPCDQRRQRGLEQRLRRLRRGALRLHLEIV